MTLRLLDVPQLQPLAACELGVETQARDVQLASLGEEGGEHYALVGLGDGVLVVFAVEPAADTGLPTLTNRKKVVLGTHPISLSCFTSSGRPCVFASCDRPTVVYSAGAKLIYTNVDLSEVSHMVPFHSELFPECLALASETTLTIGTVDEIKKLHVRTVPVGETPRRLAYAARPGVMAVGTEFEVETEDGRETRERVVFMDNPSFEELLSHELDPLEMVLTCTAADLRWDGDTRSVDDASAPQFFAVGTAYVIPEEPEPTRGRILIFRADMDRKVALVAEKETRGPVYVLHDFQGKLLAGIGGKVMLLRWVDRPDGVSALENECSHAGHIMVLYLKTRGDLILVGDMVRSVVLLEYKARDQMLEEKCRDFSSNYLRSIEILDDDHFLAADDFSNLYVVRRNGEAASDEERGRMELQGEMHLGEDVNVCRKGALNVQPQDNPGGAVPMVVAGGPAAAETTPSQGDAESSLPPAVAADEPVLLGCVSGALVAVIPVSEPLFRLLRAVEGAMRGVVAGVGGLNHAEYRAFTAARRQGTQRCMVDGDMVETLLELQPEQLATVATHVAQEMQLAALQPQELLRAIEDMARLH